MMWRDPIVDEVRKQREEYARRFNFDLDAIHRDLKMQEQTSGKKVVRLQPKRIAPKSQRETALPAALH